MIFWRPRVARNSGKETAIRTVPLCELGRSINPASQDSGTFAKICRFSGASKTVGIRSLESWKALRVVNFEILVCWSSESVGMTVYLPMCWFNPAGQSKSLILDRVAVEEEDVMSEAVIVEKTVVVVIEKFLGSRVAAFWRYWNRITWRISEGLLLEYWHNLPPSTS